MTRKRRKQKQQPSPEIKQALENLVRGILTNQSDTVTIPINLTIPKSLYKTYEAAANQYGLSIQSALENLASVGIQKALKDSLKPDGDLADLAKSQGLDLTPLTDGLGRITELVTQISGLQKVFESNESGPTRESK